MRGESFEKKKLYMEDDLLKHLEDLDLSLYVSFETHTKIGKIRNYLVFQWIFLGITLCFFLSIIMKSDVDYQERAIAIASYSVMISIISFVYQNVSKKNSIETDDIEQIEYHLFVNNILQVYCSNSISVDQKEELYRLITKIHDKKVLSQKYKDGDFNYIKEQQELNKRIESYIAKFKEKKSSTSQLEDTE